MKRPEILYIDAYLVDKAVSLWRAGELVVMPTETVYGLGADASNGQAVAKIYAVKSRPQFNPLIVHVADKETAQRYVVWNEAAEVLAQKFWPGPLTLVLKRRADCPISELVSAGGETIAIRVPSHPVARQLLAAFGGGIAAPSANRSGRVSPTTASHVEAELGEVIPLIIDGGACEVGLESTVLDLSGDAPVLLRPGSVTREMLELTLNGAAWDASPLAGEATRLSASALSRSGEGASKFSASLSRPPIQPSPARGEGSAEAPLIMQLKSPGMLESHYAPSIKVRLNAQDVLPNEALLAFGPTPLPGAGATLNLSESGDLIEAAANLFAHLRALDDPRFAAIAVMPIPSEGIGEAMNDRLKRAAA